MKYGKLGSATCTQSRLRGKAFAVFLFLSQTPFFLLHIALTLSDIPSDLLSSRAARFSFSLLTYFI